MSEITLNRRERIAVWLCKRDTALYEFFASFACFIVGWRAVEMIDGRPAAPFTSSAVLRFEGGFWFWMLLIMGALKLLTLTHGLCTGNTYRWRSYVTLAASCVWSGVLVGSLTAPGPWSASAGYAMLMICSWIAAVILIARADAAKHKARHAAQHGRARELVRQGDF